MSGKCWDRVYDTEPLSRCERVDAEPLFDWLNGVVPFLGSKVDWSRVEAEQHHERRSSTGMVADRDLAAICALIPSGSPVVHVGDGLSEFGVVFDPSDSFLMIGCLLEIPEHHYFVADERSWLGVITFEGDADLAVGLRPSLDR